jgi:hypothetical protein
MKRHGHVPSPPVRFPARAAPPHVQAAIAQAKVAPAPPSGATPAAHVQRALNTVQPKAAEAPRPGAAQAKLQPAPPRGPAVVQPARFGRPIGKPEPVKLEYEKSTQNTFAVMLVYRIGAFGVQAGAPTIAQYFSSGGGYHAEEKALLHLQAKVNDGTLTHHNGGLRPDWRVVLFLSKSPCSSTSDPPTRTDGQPGCLERLNQLMMNGLTNPLGETVIFIVNLAATKPYQPPISGAKDASKDNYNNFGGGGSSFGFVR